MESNPAEPELRAFVGRKADYYLNAWYPVLFASRGPLGFNVAGLVFSGLWLGYRKMYRVTFLFFAFVIVEALLEWILFVVVLEKEEVPPALAGLVGFVLSIVVAANGNRWYLSHARRVIGEVRALGLSEEDHLRALAARGGTSLGASLGLFLLFLLAIMVLATLIVGLLGEP